MRITIDPYRVRAAFSSVSADPCFTESAAVVARGGEPVEMLQAMAMLPGGLQAMSALCYTVYPGGRLDRPLTERIIVQVARLLNCQFCYASHLDIMKERGIHPVEPPHDLRTAVAIVWATDLTRHGNNIERDWNTLRLHFTQEEAVELTALVCLINGLARFNNALGVRYNGEYRPA